MTGARVFFLVFYAAIALLGTKELIAAMRACAGRVRRLRRRYR